ncbi:cell filamentation protein [Mesorhizobium tianshanense]|uniref:Fic-DOC domain mobile mystery protein B n=1 Tax=Mesorhizobium tianshanense TaxID=39844 RepID=A0A562MSI1_9HYPH|nr:mobile mystery protein B [Mesorhizobium tianshanense]TWI22800.1 Fic-DOC domain mobile mystery protein B [Mesorhizobium tianshanense]GLS37817.1 cell filamentation protein [Mesorhizobium tianshanense]
MEDDPLFQDDDEANTPLNAEEREQLIPSYITLRHELNEAEQVNIGEGLRWAMSRRRNVLDQKFLNELHRRMFGEVWRWAGQYRTTARNIGIDAYRIPMDVRQTVDDVRHWVEHGAYPPDEIAVRFSHRLVAIHPFPNGNGRFSRLVGDLHARQLGRPPFSWGRANLVDAGKTRARYVAALRAADNHEIEPLLAFAHS